MKTCTGCNKTKALIEFHKHCRKSNGLRARCKVCVTAHNKRYKQNNREKCNASARKREKRPEFKKKRRASRKKRYHSDPQYKLTRRLRARLRHALKGKLKSASTMKLLGCSYSHAQNHLEKQFISGMTWENQGKWHVDHMMPCASFDLSCPEHQRRCFHYTNLQPMWGKENKSKGDKIIYNREWNGTRWINIA